MNAEEMRATAEHRGSTLALEQKDEILKSVAADTQMERMWKLYAARYPYASHLTFQNCIDALARLLS